MNKAHKRSAPLLLLVAVFLIPVLAAKLILSQNWYQTGATNSGELLSSELTYQHFKMDNPAPRRWQMAYLLPEQCLQACQHRLYILQQSYRALAKDKHRLVPVVFITPVSDTSVLKAYQFNQVTASPQMSEFLQQQLVIVDPLGALVMAYQFEGEQQPQLMLAKAMVADIRKLLKLSRVG